MTKKDYIKLADSVAKMIIKNIDHATLSAIAYKTSIEFCTKYNNFNKDIFDSYVSKQIYNHYIAIEDQEGTEEKVSLFEDTIKYY